MTEEQKDILIARMLECPAELTDAEVMQILEDDELRDVYSISVDLKAAKNCQTEIDASAEWRRFLPRLVKPRRWNFSRVASIAVIFAGILLVAAGIFVMTNNEQTNQPPLIADAQVQEEDPITPEEIQTPSVEDNTMDHPLQEQPNKRKHKPTKPQENLLAETSQSIDVEEYLRIQQARMDNDFAEQCAEAVVNQYYAMADINEAMQSDLGDGYNMNNELVTLIIP